MAGEQAPLAAYRTPDGQEHELTTRDIAVAGLWSELDKDPKYRQYARALVAHKFPQTADMFPETAVKKALDPEIKLLRDEREAFRKEREAAETDKAVASLHAKFAQLGVTDPGDVESVKTYMKDNLTASPDLAVMGWREARRIATPSAAQYSGLITPGSKGSGEFFMKSPFSGISIAQDWKQWRHERATKDVADLMAGRPLDPIAG